MNPVVTALILALIGGLIIGLATSILLLANGKIAGISGIVSGLFESASAERNWRLLFLFGMLAGGAVVYLVQPALFGAPLERSTAAIVSAGVLVGFGTRLGSGCTSGHGICGLSRLSARSFVAVLTFMAAGIVTVYITHQLLGWAV